ncbi:MAG: alpha/beta hydrolase [Granulosicoccus sp.]
MAYLQKLISLLSAATLIIAILIAILYLFQNRLLYLPVRSNLDNYVPEGLALWPADRSLTEFSADNVLGLVAEPAAGPTPLETAIVFHGNAGHAGHREYYAQQITALDVRVILAEYPGYGPRPGKPQESLLVDDAVNLVKLAHEQYGQPIWLIGESLGAGVAAAVAGREPSLIRGIVLITPWNRLVNVASHHYPFLPVRLLLTNEYDSIKSLSFYNGPKLVVVADNDTIVPAELGLDLYQNLEEPKRLNMIENAGHNNWLLHSPPSIWTDAISWLRQAQS